MRYRKFSPINREHPIFELVDGDVVLFDVSRSDEGKAEIAFHDGVRGRILELRTLERLLAEGRALVDGP